MQTTATTDSRIVVMPFDDATMMVKINPTVHKSKFPNY
jgi:hypothetical protein